MKYKTKTGKIGYSGTNYIKPNMTKEEKRLFWEEVNKEAVELILDELRYPSTYKQK